MAKPSVDWEKRIEKTMGLIQGAVDADCQAPPNAIIPGGNRTLDLLVRERRIRIELYPSNWRVIHIIETGERTAEYPRRNNGPHNVKESYNEYKGTDRELTWEERQSALDGSLKSFKDRWVS